MHLHIGTISTILFIEITENVFLPNRNARGPGMRASMFFHS